jgi:4-amino-4-deoxy-L-arabinose transferase-like glycosyltransferase
MILSRHKELNAVKISARWVWIAVVVLLALQAAQVLYVVHRESPTWDEGDHMFAGYMMWRSSDYGLNPEHPPLVKLLATLPLLGKDLWTPPLQGRSFKAEAYLDGRDWLARNDGASQKLVFRMRLMAGLLALGLSLVIFFAAREWFGVPAALLALLLAVFEPNLLGHSALVTTDMGVTLFFLASIYAFYRYCRRPSLARLLLAGLAAGLLLATKHSGILLAPMLVLLILWELACAPTGTRRRMALRLAGAFAAIVMIGVVVLWSFYGFRYAARPAGLALSSSLANYAAQLKPFDSGAVLLIARLHLLPESYLMGLVDVKRMAEDYPTFIFGTVYSHGQWWYFPAVIAIKTTLGLLALLALTAFAIFTGRLRKGRELAFILIPATVYLAVAMLSGMNIGARHILPLYALACILAGAGVIILAANSRRWAWICAALIVAHIASALAAFPNYIPYANEAWGGPANLHNLLSDANVDWAQQLYQVRDWQQRNPGQECWFAYFAYPEFDPATYGIHCHPLPTLDTFWLSGEEITPPEIQGAVLISAGDLSGCEWPSGLLNPYIDFQRLKPDETIDSGIFVYRGRFQIKQAAALSRAELAYELLGKGNAPEALKLAREAVAIDPAELFSQTALGDAAATVGLKDEARKAWQAALDSARQLEAGAQTGYVGDLEAKLKKL